MPDEQPTRDLCQIYDERERDVLYLLTDPQDNQPLWSINDLAREMDTPGIIDSVNALHRAGLINRTSDGYVFATRPGVRLVQLVGRAV